MPPPSIAREFFNGIVKATDPIAAIRALVNSDPPTFETDWRDFKTEHLDPKQRAKKAREAWSEALGGFANNQGGVLIWGVDARKTKVGEAEIDYACGEKPVDNPHALKSRLIEFQRGATEPALANVEIEALPFPDNPGKGFVVCYVPEGSFKPYRSEQAGQQWFLRAGDNTVVMSPAMLRSLFYPRTQAVFRVEAELSWVFPDAGKGTQIMETRLDLEVRVANMGTATAKDIRFMMDERDLSPNAPTYYQAGGWDRLGQDSWGLALLHPGMPSRQVFGLCWTTPATTLHSRENRVVPLYRDPQFSFSIYAENQQPQHFNVRFGMEELIHAGRMTVVASPDEGC